MCFLPSGGNNAGAAGGSVYIITGSLLGSGVISANGNAGPNASGGGGPIAVFYADGSGYTGFTKCSASAGSATAENGTMGLFDTSIPNLHLQVLQRFVLDSGSQRHFGALTVANGGLLTVGGGSTLQVDGALSVRDNSALVLQATNVSGLVYGQWIGQGVNVFAGTA